MLPPWTSPFAAINERIDAEEHAQDLAQDLHRAAARETRFPMADFEDDDGRLPNEANHAG